MKSYLGIDLGSTTSKAIIIDENDNILGRGITNTRANYEVAAELAKQQAIYNARFHFLKERLGKSINQKQEYKRYLKDLENAFLYLQFKDRLDTLESEMKKVAKEYSKNHNSNIEYVELVSDIFKNITPELKEDYLTQNLGTKNQFFRDIVSEKYNEKVEKLDKKYFEPLMIFFDKSINPVENEIVNYDFEELINKSILLLDERYSYLQEKEFNSDAELQLLMGNYKNIKESLKQHIENVSKTNINIANMVGTGYGRALLPFPKECIKSEILCHAFGAHAIFPNTRTVLDIGGQDTKAIQVDKYGLVTSFHMNDRCAAGCGRYLGYIAGEFGLSLNELGPMALSANKETNICSTCTVFAGAEVRELLNIGEKKEDILAGLHKAIVMRAMSLLSRSGGVRNEFTFTGGVARNKAVVKYVSDMVRNNYDKNITINIHHDSIFMGALGGAMFARHNTNVDLPQEKKIISKKV